VKIFIAMPFSIMLVFYSGPGWWAVALFILFILRSKKV